MVENRAFAPLQLQAAYQLGGGDYHPNRHANEVIGPQLVKFVIEAAETFRTAQR